MPSPEPRLPFFAPFSFREMEWRRRKKSRKKRSKFLHGQPLFSPSASTGVIWSPFGCPQPELRVCIRTCKKRGKRSLGGPRRKKVDKKAIRRKARTRQKTTINSRQRSLFYTRTIPTKQGKKGQKVQKIFSNPIIPIRTGANNPICRVAPSAFFLSSARSQRRFGGRRRPTNPPTDGGERKGAFFGLWVGPSLPLPHSNLSGSVAPRALVPSPPPPEGSKTRAGNGIHQDGICIYGIYIRKLNLRPFSSRHTFSPGIFWECCSSGRNRRPLLGWGGVGSGRKSGWDGFFRWFGRLAWAR